MSALVGGLDLGRRALEEEILEPILAPVPWSLATPLEKQLAAVIGAKGKQSTVPRLPRDVDGCKTGGRCCWRWLARAALQEVCGVCLTNRSLSDFVPKMKQEIQALREEHGQLETYRMRFMQAEDALISTRTELEKSKLEAKDIRSLERETGRVQEESAELRALNGKLEAQLAREKHEVSKLQDEMRERIDAETAPLRARAEEAERALVKAQAEADELQKRLFERDQQLQSTKTVTASAKPKLSAAEMRRQRAARRGALKKKANRKKGSSSRGRSR